MICVPNLKQGIEAYTRIGFSVQPGGDHTSGGTHNALAFFKDDYLELLAVREGQQQAAGAALLEFLARGGGLRYIALQSDDLAADVAAMRSRGVDVSGPTDGGRRTPAGQTLRWRSASLPPDTPLPIFFIQHRTPLGERRGRGGAHPNGVYTVERVYINVTDVGRAAETYAPVLGMPGAKVQRGAGIKGRMAVFVPGGAGPAGRPPTGLA